MTNLIAPSGNTFGKRGKRNRQPSARDVVAIPIGVSHTLHA